MSEQETTPAVAPEDKPAQPLTELKITIVARQDGEKLNYEVTPEPALGRFVVKGLLADVLAKL